MTEDAAGWSEHDVDRRFDQGEPYDELTRLAATLDALLERLAASLRHEQRLTAELSHELRTPLARICGREPSFPSQDRTNDAYRAGLEAMPRNAGADDAHRRGARLGRPAGGGLAARRATRERRSGHGPRPCARTRPGSRSGFRSRRPIARLRSRPTSRTDRSSSPRQCCSLRSIAGPGRARVSGTTAVVDVHDDGAGVSGRTRRASSSSRVSAAPCRRPRGAGLGLALARRLAGTAGGEIVPDGPADTSRSASHSHDHEWLLGLPPLLVYARLFAVVAAESFGPPRARRDEPDRRRDPSQSTMGASRSSSSSRQPQLARSSVTTSASFSGGTRAGGS